MENNIERVHEPLIRIAKRANLDWKKSLVLNLAAVLFALVAGGIFLLAMKYNPIDFYKVVITGCFANEIYIKLLIRTVVPLFITSIGVAVAFKMRFWNVGGEGQFLMGALFAATAGLSFASSLPPHIAAIVSVVFGIIGGGVYGVITALLKVRFGTNETLLTLMLNYIALYILKYHINTEFFKKPANGIPVFKQLPASTWLTEINLGGITVDTSLFVAIAVLVLAFIYFNYSKHGYEIAVVGDSPNTAKYAGMNVKKVIIRTMFLSSALVGLAGALQLTGSAANHTINTGITGGMGWTGVIVSWLAKLNPIAIFVVSFLMGVLEKGCSVARTTFGVPNAVADILQGIILFSVLAFDFFVRYRIVFRGTEKKLYEKAHDGAKMLPVIELSGTETPTDLLIDVGTRPAKKNKLANYGTREDK